MAIQKKNRLYVIKGEREGEGAMVYSFKGIGVKRAMKEFGMSRADVEDADCFEESEGLGDFKMLLREDVEKVKEMTEAMTRCGFHNWVLVFGLKLDKKARGARG